jgi:hypothetical protein
MSELNKILRAKFKKGSPEFEKDPEAVPAEQITSEPQFDIDLYSAEYQERDIIRLLLLYGQEVIHIKLHQNDEEESPVGVADYVVHDVTHDEMEFENVIFKTIFEEYITGVEKDDMPDRTRFLSHNNSEISLAAVNLVFTPYDLSPNWLKNNIMVTTEETRLHMHVRHALMAFKARKLDKMMSEIQKKLAVASLPEEQTSLQKAYLDLKKQSIRINSDSDGLGRIITR